MNGSLAGLGHQGEDWEGGITQRYKEAFGVMDMFIILVVKLYTLNVCTLLDTSKYVDVCMRVCIYCCMKPG